MPLINWSDRLSVNVTEIDNQHQKLIEMINDLSDAMMQGKSNEVMGAIVNNLIGYVATHFKTEEKYFSEFGYPDTEAHVKEHVNFVQKVTEFKDGFEKGEIALSIGVLNFLCDWLRNHIKGTDQKYTQCFNANGLS